MIVHREDFIIGQKLYYLEYGYRESRIAIGINMRDLVIAKKKHVSIS